MSLNRDTLLAAISSTEASSFNETCSGLGADCPEKGDRAEWREFFSLLNEAERDGLIEIERVDGKIESAILTEAGASLVRAKLDGRRGLLGIEGV